MSEFLCCGSETPYTTTREPGRKYRVQSTSAPQVPGLSLGRFPQQQEWPQRLRRSVCYARECTPGRDTLQPFFPGYQGNHLGRVPGRGLSSAKLVQKMVVYWKEGARRFCISHPSRAAPLDLLPLK